ncbi:MAG: aspartate aminotransferase family protein [Bacteroidales bacterium]|nr:aspartate aminotransferase family protein [Bacteroidales bacterium]
MEGCPTTLFLASGELGIILSHMKSSITPFYYPTDKLIEKAKDCYLYDSEGKEYIDFESGVWCVNIGHNNPAIGDMIKSLNRAVIHHGYKFRNHYAEDLSLKLQQLIGIQNGSSVFLSSGSEAVNLSITLAQHLTGRRRILKIDNSYLSAYGFGQISSDNEYTKTIQFNDYHSIDKIEFDDVSAFVIETGGASVDVVKIPDVEFLNQIAELARKRGCLLIADEVTTGMGRVGKWFGFQHYNITPDIVVTGKALGNGYPVSAVTINSVTSGRFKQNSFRYAQSHQNDPLGCAIGLEVIKTIEDNNLILKGNKIGQYFIQQLEQIGGMYCDKIMEVRGRGLILALEFNSRVDGEKINNELFNNGFVIGFKNNTLRFLPPLTIMASDIDKMIDMLDLILKGDKIKLKMTPGK